MSAPEGESAAERIARLFHATYEAMAPTYHYSTRRESAVPWEDVPKLNRALMIATVHHLLDRGVILEGQIGAQL